LKKSKIIEELIKIKIPEESAIQMIDILGTKSLDELEKKLTTEQQSSLKDLKDLFSYAKSYGFQDWIKFDASIVRGLEDYLIILELFLKHFVLIIKVI